MSRRRIGQETFSFTAGGGRGRWSLDDLGGLIDWAPIERELACIACAAKGEPAWPPLALFKALLIAVWHDLSDVKLAEALDDRASFRRFCGFSVVRADAGAHHLRAVPQGARDARAGAVAVRDGDGTARGQDHHGEDCHAGRCDDRRVGEKAGWRSPLGRAPWQARRSWLQGTCRGRRRHRARRADRRHLGQCRRQQSRARGLARRSG